MYDKNHFTLGSILLIYQPVHYWYIIYISNGIWQAFPFSTQTFAVLIKSKFEYIVKNLEKWLWIITDIDLQTPSSRFWRQTCPTEKPQGGRSIGNNHLSLNSIRHHQKTLYNHLSKSIMSLRSPLPISVCKKKQKKKTSMIMAVCNNFFE